MTDLGCAKPRLHRLGLSTISTASGFRRPLTALNRWLHRLFAHAGSAGRIARIDPDRWSNAMLKDIGLGDLAHRKGAGSAGGSFDWRR